jgi:hypothetical protein
MFDLLVRMSAGRIVACGMPVRVAVAGEGWSV